MNVLIALTGVMFAQVAWAMDTWACQDLLSEAQLQSEREHHMRRVLKYGGEVIRPNEPGIPENDRYLNCHGYTCLMSDLPGVNKRIDQAQFAINLSANFDLIEVINIKDIDSFTDDPQIHDKDVIAFVENGIPVHSGLIVRKASGQNTKIWVRSKLGMAFTFEGPINRSHFYYDFDRAEIWRRRSHLGD